MKIDSDLHKPFLIDLPSAPGQYLPLEDITKNKKDDDKLKQAARDFEAIFVGQIMRNMRQSLSESGMFGKGVASDIYSSMFDDQMAQAIASKGGLHLSDTIINSLNKNEDQPQPLPGLALADYRSRAVKLQSEIARQFDWDRSIITEAAKKYSVDPALIESVIKVESDFRANAVSKKGAVGLMQLMKPTANDLGVRNRFDPRENVFGGTKYLKGLLQRFDGNLELALAAYNAGPAAVEEYNGVPPYEETQRYVEKVLKYFRDM